MKNICRAAAVLLLGLFAAGVVPAQETDIEGSKDHPMFNRMPGFYISRYEDNAFETHPFLLSNKTEVQVEGHFTHILYSIKSGAKEPSRIQILRNYENAMVKAGGTVLVSDADGSSFMKLVKGGKEVWVQIDAYITSQYGLYVVEKGAMAQDIVTNADALANDIRSTGHVAVYGILFDTGKSVIKPESDAVIAQVAKLLKADPGLKIFVVGHTDTVGDLAFNMKLSQARADAVVQALVTRQGIEAARLKSFGAGPYAPVASNGDEEGRAKNRRVELVKQ